MFGHLRRWLFSLLSWRVAVFAAWAALFGLGAWWSAGYIARAGGVDLAASQLLEAVSHLSPLTLSVGILLAFALRNAIFFPSFLLLVFSGLALGPVWGFAVGMAGEMLSATIGYFFARFVFHAPSFEFLAQHFHVIFAKNPLLRLAMLRSLPIMPFDAVNVAAGAFGLRFSVFFWGSFLGLCAPALMYVSAGSAANNPVLWFVPLGLLAALGVASIFAYRSATFAEAIQFSRKKPPKQ